MDHNHNRIWPMTSSRKKKDFTRLWADAPGIASTSDARPNDSVAGTWLHTWCRTKVFPLCGPWGGFSNYCSVGRQHCKIHSWTASLLSALGREQWDAVSAEILSRRLHICILLSLRGSSDVGSSTRKFRTFSHSVHTRRIFPTCETWYGPLAALGIWMRTSRAYIWMDAQHCAFAYGFLGQSSESLSNHTCCIWIDDHWNGSSNGRPGCTSAQMTFHKGHSSEVSLVYESECGFPN